MIHSSLYRMLRMRGCVTLDPPSFCFFFGGGCINPESVNLNESKKPCYRNLRILDKNKDFIKWVFETIFRILKESEWKIDVFLIVPSLEEIVSFYSIEKNAIVLKQDFWFRGIFPSPSGCSLVQILISSLLSQLSPQLPIACWLIYSACHTFHISF